MKPVKPSFDFLRARLERQYLDPDFDPSTGLDARIEAYWDAHSGEPLIRTERYFTGRGNFPRRKKTIHKKE